MRLFIGIDLPEGLKELLLKFQSELKDLGITGYWKSQDNFHITLEFLGELEPDSVAVLSDAMSKVVENRKPFQLSIEGLGGFPNLNRPHTLWSAVKGGLKELDQLQDDLHRELQRQGFHLESRKFKPHLTLASRPSLNDVELATVRNKVLGDFGVNKITLFESREEQGKRIYTDLFSAPLQEIV